jgi:hypothetical protein
MFGNLTETEVARVLGIKAKGSLTEGEVYRTLYWEYKELQGKSLEEQRAILKRIGVIK